MNASTTTVLAESMSEIRGVALYFILLETPHTIQAHYRKENKIRKYKIGIFLCCGFSKYWIIIEAKICK